MLSLDALDLALSNLFQVVKMRTSAGFVSGRARLEPALVRCRDPSETRPPPRPISVLRFRRTRRGRSRPGTGRTRR
eukprot:7073982-Prymnesium_polylepis.1